MFKNLKNSLVVSTVVILSACGGGGAEKNYLQWDLASNFSLSNNPNGQWSYGSSPTPGGTMTVFTRLQDATEVVTDGGSIRGWKGENRQDLNYFPSITYFNGPANTNISFLTQLNGVPVVTQRAGGVVLHPWYSEYALARWTAPKSGSYNISANFYSAHVYAGSATTEVGVYKNGELLFTDILDLVKLQTSWNTTSAVTLNIGDFINIVVGPSSGGMGSDSTGVDVVIRDTQPIN